MEAKVVKNMICDGFDGINFENCSEDICICLVIDGVEHYYCIECSISELKWSLKENKTEISDG